MAVTHSDFPARHMRPTRQSVGLLLVLISLPANVLLPRPSASTQAHADLRQLSGMRAPPLMAGWRCASRAWSAPRPVVIRRAGLGFVVKPLFWIALLVVWLISALW